MPRFALLAIVSASTLPGAALAQSNCQGTASKALVSCPDSAVIKFDVSAEITQVNGTTTSLSNCVQLITAADRSIQDGLCTVALLNQGGTVRWDGCFPQSGGVTCKYDICGTNCAISDTEDVPATLPITTTTTTAATTTVTGATTAPPGDDEVPCDDSLSGSDKHTILCNGSATCTMESITKTGFVSKDGSISSSLINGDGTVTISGGEAGFSFECANGGSCSYDCCGMNGHCTFDGKTMNGSSGDAPGKTSAATMSFVGEGQAIMIMAGFVAALVL